MVTKIEYDQTLALAKSHDNTVEGLNQQRNLLTGHIQTLAASNQSQMMTSLQNVHNSWDDQMKQIVQTLEDMANSVRAVVAGLSATDDENSATITRSAGVADPASSSGMSGFLGQS